MGGSKQSLARRPLRGCLLVVGASGTLATMDAALTTGKSESALALAMHLTPGKMDVSLQRIRDAGMCAVTRIFKPAAQPASSTAGRSSAAHESNTTRDFDSSGRALLCVALRIADGIDVELRDVHPSGDGSVNHADGGVIADEVQVVL